MGVNSTEARGGRGGRKERGQVKVERERWGNGGDAVVACGEGSGWVGLCGVAWRGVAGYGGICLCASISSGKKMSFPSTGARPGGHGRFRQLTYLCMQRGHTRNGFFVSLLPAGGKGSGGWVICREEWIWRLVIATYLPTLVLCTYLSIFLHLLIYLQCSTTCFLFFPRGE